MARQVKKDYSVKVAWYSGKNELPDSFHAETFDYIKTGRYDERFGPLNSLTTNQRMIKRLADGRVKDITSRFQKTENGKRKTENDERVPLSSSL